MTSAIQRAHLLKLQYTYPSHWVQSRRYSNPQADYHSGGHTRLEITRKQSGRTINGCGVWTKLFRAKKSAHGKNFVLVIHGGAVGTMSQESPPEKCATYREALGRALKAGHEVLKLRGEAMDAAVAAVTVMEDSPLFNAGKGAVFNVAGKIELESSIMLSKPPAAHPAIPTSRRGASVALITHTKNPCLLARALYLAPQFVPHPMLAGPTAEAIGFEHLGIETVDPSYFWTEHRWREHRRGLIKSLRAPDSGSSSTQIAPIDGKFDPLDINPAGTVGAVALDIRGCIAAVSSTGGRTNKLVGRVGDTAVMGSGFWAEEWKREGSWFKKIWGRLTGKLSYGGVGVSCTGDGDHYIRQNAASMLAHRMRYLDESLGQASQRVIDDLSSNGEKGGIIAVDRRGNVAVPMNCDGMYRGVIRPDGVPMTAIFFDDELSEL